MNKIWFYRNKQKGFVLLFVMGALVLVVALFLGISIVTRDKVNQVTAQRAVTESDYILKGVIQVVLAKIHVDIDLASPGNQVEAGRYRLPPAYEAWTASMLPKPLNVEGETFLVQVIDARWLPDANTLSPEEWLRLLTGLGMESTEAQTIMEQIVEKKDRVLGSFGGYQTFNQIFSGLVGPTTALHGSADGSVPGLIDVLTVGTGTRATHPLYTPLIVYKALYNASDEQLKKLSALRTKGAVSRQQESELLGLTGQPPLDNASPTLLKVVITPAAPRTRVGSAGVVAWITVTGMQAKVVNEYLFYRE